MINKKDVLEKIKMNIALSNFEKENDKSDFELEKNDKFWKIYSLKRRLITTAFALFLLIPAVVFAYETLFSSLNGDDLSLKGEYNGEGIVTIYIENKSSKNLKLEDDIKIIKWSTNEEIEQIGDGLKFSNKNIKPNSKNVIKIDLSNTYDLDMLEEPLDDDHYYIVLTNNNFAYGQDWHCTVDFEDKENNKVQNKIENKVLLEENTNNQIPEEIDSNKTNDKKEVNDELKSYFNDYVTNHIERNEKITSYYQDAQDIISREIANGKNVITTSNPWLFVNRPDSSVIFDERVPQEYQYQLISENHSPIDGFNIPVGSSEIDNALVLSVIIPQSKKDINVSDGTTIPLVYIYQYKVSEINKPNTYVFVRGRLLSTKEIEKYRVYQDSDYVCYDFTDFFYTNLDEYINIMTNNGNKTYVDEGVKLRIKNVYNYLRNKENINKLFYYHK